MGNVNKKADCLRMVCLCCFDESFFSFRGHCDKINKTRLFGENERILQAAKKGTVTDMELQIQVAQAAKKIMEIQNNVSKVIVGKEAYTLPTVTNRREGTFRSLRYAFGGDHPSQTTHQTVSSQRRVRTQIIKGPYFNSGSTNTGVPASKPPAYPTHQLPKFNVKL